MKAPLDGIKLSILCQADLHRKTKCKLSHVLHGVLTLPPWQVWGSVIRLADISGTRNTMELGCGYLCELVYLWLWQPYPSAMLKAKQFPCEKWTKHLWPVQWVHSASPGNMWNAEFTAVTDFFTGMPISLPRLWVHGNISWHPINWNLGWEKHIYLWSKTVIRRWFLKELNSWRY